MSQNHRMVALVPDPDRPVPDLITAALRRSHNSHLVRPESLVYPWAWGELRRDIVPGDWVVITDPWQRFVLRVTRLGLPRPPVWWALDDVRSLGRLSWMQRPQLKHLAGVIVGSPYEADLVRPMLGGLAVSIAPWADALPPGPDPEPMPAPSGMKVIAARAADLVAAKEAVWAFDLLRHPVREAVLRLCLPDEFHTSVETFIRSINPAGERYELLGYDRFAAALGGASMCWVTGMRRPDAPAVVLGSRRGLPVYASDLPAHRAVIDARGKLFGLTERVGRARAARFDLAGVGSSLESRL